MAYKNVERLQHGDIVRINLRPFLPYYTIGKVIDYSYKFQNIVEGIFLHISDKIIADNSFLITEDIFLPNNLLLYPINIKENNEVNKFSNFICKIDMAEVKSKEYLEDIIFYSEDDYSPNPNGKMVYSLRTSLCKSLSENEFDEYSYFSDRILDLSTVQLKIVQEILKIKQIQPENIANIDTKSLITLSEYRNKVSQNSKAFIHLSYQEKFRSIDKMQIDESYYHNAPLEISEKSFERGKIVFSSCLIYGSVKDAFNKYNIIPIPQFWKYLLWNQLRKIMSSHPGIIKLNIFYASKLDVTISLNKDKHKKIVLTYIKQLLTDNSELDKALSDFKNDFKNVLFLSPKDTVRAIIGCLKFFEYASYREFLTLFYCMNKADNYYALQIDMNGYLALNPDVKSSISPEVSELFRQNTRDFIVKLAPKIKDSVMIDFIDRSIIISAVKEKQSDVLFRFFKSIFTNKDRSSKLINILDSTEYTIKIDGFLKEYQHNITLKVAKENLPLDEDKFWAIIENNKSNSESEDDYYQGLIKLLSEYDADTILQFGIRTRVLERMAHNADLWRAAHILKSGCTDDAFEAFKRWLIIQGREVFESAIQDPDSLCQYDFNDDWDFDFEKLADVHIEAFENKYLREAEDYISYNMVGKYAKSKILDMEDKHFEDAILKKKCPKLFEKYVSNQDMEQRD